LKPILLKHFKIRVQPAEQGSDDALIFRSERRRLVVNANSIDEFLERVVPLLDGQHTLEDIQERLAGTFTPQDLENSLSVLLQHRIVEDAERAALPVDLEQRLAPQLSYLREVSPDPTEVMERLGDSTVTILGLGAIGTVAATALAATNVGRVRCVDSSAVSPADPYLAQIFTVSDVGRSRAEVTREKIGAVSEGTSVDVLTDELLTDEDVSDAIEGSDFVLSCADPGLSSITHKLNRACLVGNVAWASAMASAFEGVVGPTVLPYETACYLCYQMRAIACTDDPDAALSDLRYVDASKTDDSPHRENLAFGAGIVGNLLALEAFKALTGLRPTTAGRILILDFASCALEHHVVLRKPWCPACWPGTEP
jgi:adenylyltransferase/sulfurtransferase